MAKFCSGEHLLTLEFIRAANQTEELDREEKVNEEQSKSRECLKLTMVVKSGTLAPARSRTVFAKSSGTPADARCQFSKQELMSVITTMSNPPCRPSCKQTF